MIAYICGPHSAPTKLGVAYNVANAAAAAREVMAAGHTPLCPHTMSGAIDDDGSGGSLFTWERWMDACMELLAVSDIVVPLEGWDDSRGSRLEIGRAVALGKPIVTLEALRRQTETTTYPDPAEMVGSLVS